MVEEKQESLPPCPFCGEVPAESEQRQGFWRVKHKRTCFFVIDKAAPSQEPPMLIYNRRKIAAWSTRAALASIDSQ